MVERGYALICCITYNTANPDLAKLITDTLGDSEWITNLPLLRGLINFADNASFQAKWYECKKKAKASLFVKYNLTHRNGLLVLFPENMVLLSMLMLCSMFKQSDSTNTKGS